MKSHDVIFDTRSIWTQKPRDNAQNLEAQPRGFWALSRGFWAKYPEALPRSILLKLNEGRTIPLEFRGNSSRQCSKTSRRSREVFEHCREVCPWTRAVSFSPSSISTIYFEFQKLHRAISCLYFDRGLFETLLRQWLNSTKLQWPQ